MMADGQGSEPSGKHPPDRPAPDLRAMARDWITIWHSELSAMATDRELQESWVRLVKLWADAAERATRLRPPSPLPNDEPSGRTGSAAQARAASTMAPPDDRDAAIRHLAERVAELERRLADYDASRNAGAGCGNGTDT
jgi:hypothetical protein